MPGLAKTLMVKALSATFDWKFARIQFTPDLMPSDVTGYELLGRDEHGSSTMAFRRGPVFANLVLADEINRAAPKTQSALLEAMAEQHVTVGGTTYPLDDPFLVVATQNPIEHEGTYPLPEAQLDRFLMEIRLGYPSSAQEEEIVMRTTGSRVDLPPAAFDRAAFLMLRDLVRAVPVPKSVASFAVGLCRATRPRGAGPPGSFRNMFPGRRSARLTKPGAGGQGSRAVVGPHRAHDRRHPGRGRAGAAAPRHRQSPGRGGWNHARQDRLAIAGRGRGMSTASASPFLDLRAMAALEHLRFTTRGRIEGTYSGRHTSRLHGGAGEFVDYREYTGGEDLRRLDWKVFGRTGRAYVRLYQDETNLLCTLALDVSGSMLFPADAPRRGGNRSAAAPAAANKWQYVQYLSTALSYLIARGQDQVGLALVGDQLLELMPCSSLQRHVARVHETIAAALPRPARQMAPGLRQLFERSPRRGVLLLLTDFLMDDLEETFAALRLFRHRQWEVVTLHVVHPDEERLPDGLAYRFIGLEDDGVLDCSPAEVRKEYQERFAAHLAVVRAWRWPPAATIGGHRPTPTTCK